MTPTVTTPALDELLRQEMTATNLRRLRILLPVMIVGHALHVVVFSAAKATGSDDVARFAVWRRAIVDAHFATAAVAVLLLALMLGLRNERATRWLAPTTALVYLLHGAIVVTIDQLSVKSVTPFIGYCIGVAVVFSLTPLETIASYAIALAVFVAGVTTTQHSHAARLEEMPNGFSIVVVSVALSLIFHASRRRDVAMRATIDEQREKLARLNGELERRVEEQVAEIVARAKDVERLNAQLQDRVRERSNELSIALARLARPRTRDVTLARGCVLGDRFEVDQLLGAGGMGTVYAGVDRRTKTKIAIKVIQATSSDEVDACHRFLREAKAVATITHPAVVRMLAVDVSADGLLYQAQELVEGETLQRRVRMGRPWEPAVVARLGAVLCSALAAAHAIGVVHRDVKPSNVMLTPAAPGLKLLDFGIAKLGGDANQTRTGAVLGTPIYMSPEQIAGDAATDRADVYSVGVVLFLLLSGRHPFGAPDPGDCGPGVPGDLAEIVARCLERDPTARPSAATLADALQRVAAAESLETLERENRLFDIAARAVGDQATLRSG